MQDTNIKDQGVNRNVILKQILKEHKVDSSELSEGRIMGWELWKTAMKTGYNRRYGF
jgi:hypothetical protein